MILLIDVGNTRIKWRYLEQEQIFGGGQLAHRGDISQELLNQMWGEIDPPTAIWAVSVAASRLSEQICQWSVMRWRLVPNFVAAAKQLGNVINGYREPERLGSDRWMALVGAGHVAYGACCVADCGTAVTVDCMNANHEHLGGLIFPGLTMMPRCVSNNTAQVTFTEGNNTLFGRDTSSCLTSGATQSIVSTLQRVADITEKHLSSPVTRIITGGDAPHLLPWLGKEWHYEPDLIFFGLAAVIQNNKG